jgi:Ser-tRNA(Ala) deacylase AlaX
MSTELVYLNDTYQYQGSGTLLRIDADERGSYGVCDRTIFYPQGGGQPADSGDLTVNGQRIPVTFVGFANGEVRHYGNFADLALTGAAEAGQRVDESRRLKNSQAHTAGHLVANVAESIAPELHAVKGYHFPEGSYVEFDGVLAGLAEEFIATMNERLSEAVRAEHNIQCRTVDFHELQAICPKLPAGLPQDKPLRVVQIGDFPPVPCGGTHLPSLADLKSVSISKAKSKQGKTKVSYAFA